MTTKDTQITVSRSDTTTTYEDSELGIILAVIHYHKRQWCLTCYDSPDDIHLTEWVSRENAEHAGLNHAHEVTDAINNGALAQTGNGSGTVAAHVTHSVAHEIFRQAGITESAPGNWTIPGGQTTSDLDRALTAAVVRLAENDPPRRYQPTQDPGQLREELADIYTRDLLSPAMYRRANQIIDRISRLTGISREQIITDAKADADLLEAEDHQEEPDDPRCATVTV
jgi:hypothetical protein